MSFNHVFCSGFSCIQANEINEVLKRNGYIRDLCSVHGIVTPIRDFSGGCVISRCPLCEVQLGGLKILSIYFQIPQRPDEEGRGNESKATEN
jgi:hypothetical protein